MSSADNGRPAAADRSSAKRYDLRPAADAAIVLLASLDTKAEEALFVAHCIRARGQRAWIIDIGTAGTVFNHGDTSREAVARAAGLRSLTGLSKSDAMAAVVRGASRILRDMVGRGEAAAVLGIGGGQGTWLATAIMRGLPLGFPKLMVSTAASRDISSFVEHTDIMMLPSVTDIAGINSLLEIILANAASAVCGMANWPADPGRSDKPRVALSMFGITTTGGTWVRQHLESAGCEVVVFHVNGAGGATMEALTADGHFIGVADWSTTELADELVGGIRSAGPHRLEAAGARGIPQVVVPGAMDVVNFGPPESVPRRFRGRRLYVHTPTTTLMRTSVDENRRLGKHMAQKLNRARGPVRVLIPEAGFSALGAPGGPFEDAAADAAFVRALSAELRPDIQLQRHPNNINEHQFASTVAEAMLAVCQPLVVSPGG